MRPWALASDSAGVAAVAVAAEFPRSIVAEVTVLQVAAANKRTMWQMLKWKYIMTVLVELEKICEYYRAR
jgi:hypothetical protein